MKYASLDIETLRQKMEGKKPKFPRSHQLEAFEKFSKTFTLPIDGYRAGLLVLPTGAGKTYTAVNWICRNILSKNIKVLWLAQSAYLLDQAYDSFYENAKDIPPLRETLNIRVVSSKISHSKPYEIEKSDDVIIMTSQTAYKNFNAVPSDQYGKPVETKLIQFLENIKDQGLFVVVDEAHHAPAYGMRSLLIGIKEKIPNLYLLGLTATPTHGDKKISGWLGKIFDQGILYEADKNLLISKNILAKPVYVEKNTGKDFEVNDQLYYHLMRDHKDLPPEIIKVLAEDSKRNDYIIDEYIQNKKEYGKTLIFVDRWYQCEYMKTKFNKEHGIKAEAVYSNIVYADDGQYERGSRNAEENDKIIEEFKKGKYDVLLNVRMMTEGIDVPDIQTVFVTRQTTSPILMTQMVGRALRGKEAGGGNDKEHANIVLFTDNWKRLIDWSNPKLMGYEDLEPRVRGYYPQEYISLHLIEELSKSIDSGYMYQNIPYKTYVPMGWYEVEYTVSHDENEETQTCIEFIMVYDLTREKFDKFIRETLENIEPSFADESIEDSILREWVKEKMDKYFDLTIDDFGENLENSLVKILRHLSQRNEAPIFVSFELRNIYDMGLLVKKYGHLGLNARMEGLMNEYYRAGSLWKIFYKSFYQFKIAYDMEEMKSYGAIGVSDYVQNPVGGGIIITDTIDPLLKEVVLRRDNYQCVCCGKVKARGVRLEMDHIIPVTLGGETTLDNLQTLCKECNIQKGSNIIDFKNIYKTMQEKSPEFKMIRRTTNENPEFTLSRTINFFYKAHAISNLKFHIRRNGTYYNNWVIELYDGNDANWLGKYQKEILNYIQTDLGCDHVRKIDIRNYK